VSDNDEDKVDRGLELRSGVVKRHKLVALCATIFFAIGLLYVAWYTFEFRRAQISRRLTGELRRLEVGKTTESQIRRLSEQYDGRYSAAQYQNQTHQPESYDIYVSSPYIMIAGSARTLPGRRLWGLVASLAVENGYLSHLRLRLFVFRSNGFGLHSIVDLTGPKPRAAPDGVPYYVYEAHITGPPGETLGVELSPAASTEERRKGFNFNLSCLTALRECRHVCDTLPSAWKDLTPDARLTYEDGSPVNDYRECSTGTP
jgi:hypothetical protein